MTVYLNERPHELLPDMTVRHLLLAAGFGRYGTSFPTVRDLWGNEVGLDGALGEGARLYTTE